MIKRTILLLLIIAMIPVCLNVGDVYASEGGIGHHIKEAAKGIVRVPCQLVALGLMYVLFHGSHGSIGTLSG